MLRHLADRFRLRADQLNQLSQRTLASHLLAALTVSAETLEECLRVLVKMAILAYHQAVDQSARYNN